MNRTTDKRVRCYLMNDRAHLFNESEKRTGKRHFGNLMRYSRVSPDEFNQIY